MKKNIVVIYGSGASNASGYKVKIREKEISPPTDQKFFKDIGDIFLEEEYPAIHMFKDFVFRSNPGVGMEELWTTLDLNHKHISLDTYGWEKETQEYKDRIEKRKIDNYPNFDRDERNRKYKLTGDCGRDFRRLIYDVYSNYIEPPERENRFKSLHEKISKADNCNLFGYITFNYDCYLENALKPDFSYIPVNNDIREKPNGCIPILKLHGSLNWEENPAYADIVFHNPSYEKDKQVKPDYSPNNGYIQPAIIPPTIFKQEINDDARATEPLTRIILKQWKSAINILKETDKIIFVGYSFPVSDFHSKRIFQISSMIRRRKDGKSSIQILDCVGPKNNDMQSNECNECKKRHLLKNIFGEDTPIVFVHDFANLSESKKLNEFLSS